MSKYGSRGVLKAPDVLLQDLDGEAVLLNLANGQYYGLGQSGYQMYRTLLSSASVQAACEKLLAEYEVDAGQLSADVDTFLDELLANGLVLLDQAKPA